MDTTKPITPDMKVKWRAHELLFVTLFVALKLVSHVWEMLALTDMRRAYYTVAYESNGFPYDYVTTILLPQTGALVWLYLCYLWVARLVVPLLRRILFEERTSSLYTNILLVTLHLLAISFTFALGINMATYYAHPHVINYGPAFNLLAWLGYNEQPLTNVFFGFGRALAVVTFYLLYAIVREGIIYFIEKQGPRREYKILVGNQFTTFLFIYLVVLTTLITFDLIHENTSVTVLCFVPATLLVYMSNTYWLFPLYEQSISHSGKIRFVKKRIPVPILFTTLICTFPFALLYVTTVYHDHFLLILLSWWALQLVVVTPLSWMLFQQRRDKILQLRGVEKELVKSTANLQFLRSQINPHFLFNSLNTLYGTALLENSDRTAEGIQMLGDMMRFMLHENNQDFISLNREIEYLQNYIALQKLRTQSSPNIHIEDSIRETACSHQIAPMLLIPFIENAFKHGISLQEKSWIYIRLSCDQQGIQFEVRNSRHPRKEITPEQAKSGIGLANVTERLLLLYPGRHTLSIGGDASEFDVQLSLQLSSVSNLMPVAK